jgi:PAS domain S-box-containing protein
MSRKINPTATQGRNAPAGGSSAAAIEAELRSVYALFDQAPGCMVLFVGPEHIVERANPAYLAFTGLASDIVGRPAREGLKRGYGRGFGPLLDDVYRNGQARVVRGARLLVTRRPGGPDEEAYADFVLQPVRDGEGDVYGVFLQGHEVTSDKLAADELRASRERLKAALDETQAIFDNSHDVICVFDGRGVFQQVNKHAESLWGYRPEEMVGRVCTDFLHPDDIEATREQSRRVARGFPTKTFVNRFLHKDGGVVPIMWSAVRSESQDATICIGRDMREHMAAEEKLRQAQKMEALGRLTGGVAHDFNNLLAVVIGSAEALAEMLGDRPELQGLANVALGAAERGAELVSRLLAFARSQPLAPRPVDCGRFLQDMLPILRRTIGCDIEIDVDEPAEPLFCLADATQLTSAVLNLAINARDAMPGGGRIRLRARRVLAEAGQPAFAVLSVEDSGEGMDAATRARALEPFFTTKPEGRGSGLGLSMVHGFVSQSGGRMEIDSEPGHGACMRLYLPAAAQGAPAAPEPLPHSGAIEDGLVAGTRVLLVEDDDLLREQVARQLAALGCRVAARRNGHDALHRLGAADDIDLLMTDIVMPGGMNGRQLADQARVLRPTLRVLFTSGHTDEPTIRALRMDAAAAFLPKPYRRAELARKLAEVCREPA